MCKKSAFDYPVQYYSESKNNIRHNFAPLKRYFLIFDFVLQYFYTFYFVLYILFYYFTVYCTENCSNRERKNLLLVEKSVLGGKSKAWRRHVTCSPLAVPELRGSET